MKRLYCYHPLPGGKIAVVPTTAVNSVLFYAQTCGLAKELFPDDIRGPNCSILLQPNTPLVFQSSDADLNKKRAQTVMKCWRNHYADQVQLPGYDPAIVAGQDNDCGCHTHRGPHWLYADYLRRQSNLQLLERYVKHVLHLHDLLTSREPVPMHVMRQAQQGADLAQYALATEELLRLNEKERNMRNNGLDVAPYTLLGADLPDLDEREWSLWGQARQAIESITAVSFPKREEGVPAPQKP